MGSQKQSRATRLLLRGLAMAMVAGASLWGCSGNALETQEAPKVPIPVEEPREMPAVDRSQEDVASTADAAADADEAGADAQEEAPSPDLSEPAAPDADRLRAGLALSEDFRSDFVHGEKGPEYQKYIVLHDTEGDSDASSVIDWWDSNGNFVAAHFVVNKDGSIVQCAPMDSIVHHAGFGDTGHNELYGVQDESRDDKRGTQSIGDWAADYGMNSYSIGIEMVHVGGSGDYPEAQLEALDELIAYIDAYYGFESQIIDHKAWRTGNSDTSPEFADYLASYQEKRVHA